MDLNLVPGRIYRRRDIHKEFGGQTQGGISTPRDTPVILLFTGHQGQPYGYQDGWEGDVFLYTGEGQVGDMQFARGNKAIRDHVESGKDLLLFEYVALGRVRFIGDMVCVGYRIERGSDKTGRTRSNIVFELLPLREIASEPDGQADANHELADLKNLREVARGHSAASRSGQERRRHIFERSKAIKTYVLARAKGKCESCGENAPFITDSGQHYLEVHHIRRLSDGGPDDPESTIALCPNCHRCAHYSVDREQFNRELQAKVLEIEAQMKHLFEKA